MRADFPQNPDKWLLAYDRISGEKGRTGVAKSGKIRVPVQTSAGVDISYICIEISDSFKCPAQAFYQIARSHCLH